MAFDFDALPDDAKRAFFAKVKPGKGSRKKSLGGREKPRGSTKRKNGDRANKARTDLAAAVRFAPDAKSSLQRFAELLFREHEHESKPTAEVVRDLKQLKEIVERLMQFDAQIRPFQGYERLPYPLPRGHSFPRYDLPAGLASSPVPLWAWRDKSPVHRIHILEFSDPLTDQARRLKQWARDARTLLGITWGADVNVGERKIELKGETDIDTAKAERGLTNLYRWLRTR